MKLSISCKCSLPLSVYDSFSSCGRRTYDDEDEGEDIRLGHDPSDIPPAGASEFAVGDDEEEEEAAAGQGESSDQSEEARMWAQSKRDSPSKRSDRYRDDDLDDRHVWESKDTHEEN